MSYFFGGGVSFFLHNPEVTGKEFRFVFLQKLAPACHKHGLPGNAPMMSPPRSHDTFPTKGRLNSPLPMGIHHSDSKKSGHMSRARKKAHFSVLLTDTVRELGRDQSDDQWSRQPEECSDGEFLVILVAFVEFTLYTYKPDSDFLQFN